MVPRLPARLSEYAIACLRALAGQGLGRSLSLGGASPAPWVDAIRRPDWGEAVEETRLRTSPVYYHLRSWHDLVPLPYLGQALAYSRDDPNLEHV